MKRVEYLSNKLTENYNLNNCPKCNDNVWHTGNYHFNGSEYECYSTCLECGYFITHTFEHIESEVEKMTKEELRKIRWEYLSINDHPEAKARWGL